MGSCLSRSSSSSSQRGQRLTDGQQPSSSSAGGGGVGAASANAESHREARARAAEDRMAANKARGTAGGHGRIAKKLDEEQAAGGTGRRASRAAEAAAAGQEAEVRRVSCAGLGVAVLWTESDCTTDAADFATRQWD